MQGKVEILKATCLFAGIKLPAGIEDEANALTQRPFSRDTATVSFHADEMSNERLHVDWSSPRADPEARERQSQPESSQAPQASQGQYGSRQPATTLPNSNSSFRLILIDLT